MKKSISNLVFQIDLFFRRNVCVPRFEIDIDRITIRPKLKIDPFTINPKVTIPPRVTGRPINPIRDILRG